MEFRRVEQLAPDSLDGKSSSSACSRSFWAILGESSLSGNAFEELVSVFLVSGTTASKCSLGEGRREVEVASEPMDSTAELLFFVGERMERLEMRVRLQRE